MEKKLKKLFDYQRFEKNERLEKIIRETESRYAKELSDDDLSLVNAAGEPGFISNMPNETKVGGTENNSTIVKDNDVIWLYEKSFDAQSKGSGAWYGISNSESKTEK